MAFGGTFTFDIPTYQAVLGAFLNSIKRHGFKRVFIVNGHGGNMDPLAVAVRELAVEFAMPEVRDSYSLLLPITLFINRDSGLIERVTYDSAAGAVTEEYSDYRIVEGIKVPFHTVVTRPGAGVIERDIRKIHFNVALPQGLFSRPG